MRSVPLRVTPAGLVRQCVANRACRLLGFAFAFGGAVLLAFHVAARDVALADAEFATRALCTSSRLSFGLGRSGNGEYRHDKGGGGDDD
jgi:hypothetical protein